MLLVLDIISAGLLLVIGLKHLKEALVIRPEPHGTSITNKICMMIRRLGIKEEPNTKWASRDSLEIVFGALQRAHTF